MGKKWKREKARPPEDQTPTYRCMCRLLVNQNPDSIRDPVVRSTAVVGVDMSRTCFLSSLYVKAHFSGMPDPPLD
jgi:hypothetical protein